MEIFTNILYGIVVLCIISPFKSANSTTPSLGNETDRLALLDFKNLITEDPFRFMSSWNNSIHFCNWNGVSCNASNGRVVNLNLESQRLAGSISPSIANLTFLNTINLFNNSFFGRLPEELGRLWRLQNLNLSFNSFTGNIPTNLSHCKELTVFGAAYNNFRGEIPQQLNSLSKLVFLGLGRNNLTGKIPNWIGNFSSLSVLSLMLNSFYGNIPTELGRLSRLGVLQLYGNYLSGTIPTLIYNISSLYYFTFTQNQLHGQLPAYVGLSLPNLQVFAGGVNSFTGSIPVSLSNASGLQVLDFALNDLTGSIPKNLGRLQSLYMLNFEYNNLGIGEFGGLKFLTSLANCTSLVVLRLQKNRFGGELPSSIGNLSTQLETLIMGQNLIHGSIPVGIGNLLNLTLLGLEGNLLSGNVPDSVGKLVKLEALHLNYNRFSGSIPSSFGNLTRLTRLFLEENRLGGNIPSSLGNCKNLLNLNLSSNNLNGSIPREIIALSSLSIALVMSNNSLTGSIPLEVGKLDNLRELDLSENKLSGEIPSSLGSCISLELLHLEGNEIEGAIPQSLKDLRGLAELDLSRNNLTGKIPEFLSKFSSLKNLNLSYNEFDGEVLKEGVFANASAISIIGNDKVCGGISALHLPPCSKKKQGKSPTLKVVILATIAVISVIIAIFGLVAIYYIAINPRKKQSNSEDWQGGISYFELKRSTDGFSAKNLIGSGSFGSVYKGMLPGDGRIAAVKVLNLQQQGASKSFLDECNALRSIRHRNLLRIISACSTVDHEGNDFKCLVFEFMSNGSLDKWLHSEAEGQNRSKTLCFLQRLNIAIDIASALDYLHHHCETPIVHCDLKPSNVLLDDDMTAHVGDFGLAKFLLQSNAMSVSLKGSIGYIPPEYGVGGQVSTLADVYSFGILLLEMFTGKRPTDEMFKDNLSLHSYVAMALPEHAMDVIDPIILIEEENDENSGSEDEIEEKAIMRDKFSPLSLRKLEELVVSVLRIGVSCSSTSPGNRKGMNFVVNELNDVRDSLLVSKNISRKSNRYRYQLKSFY